MECHPALGLITGSAKASWCRSLARFGCFCSVAGCTSGFEALRGVRDVEFDPHEHLFCRHARSRPVRAAPSFAALRRVDRTAEGGARSRVSNPSKRNSAGVELPVYARLKISF